MNIITISKKEYTKLQKEQIYLRSELSCLKEIVKEAIREEIAPNVVKRLLVRSKRIDKGLGLKFQSTGDLKKYLRQM